MYQDGVTIAIPNWNHEFFLPRSIRSALVAVDHLRSGGVGAEVLVVDDASRDGSHAMLRTLEAFYHEAGLRVHIHASNAGLCAARNTALLEARYRHIVLLDADNEVLGANMPLFHRALAETSAAAVYGNLLIQKMGHRAAHGICSNESVQNRLFDMNYIDAFAMLDRPQILDVGGYSSSLPAHEDWEMWLHLSTNGRRIVFVPLTFGYYYEIPNSMLRTLTEGELNQLARSRRMFNQVGFRTHRLTNTDQLRYLPGVGYL